MTFHSNIFVNFNGKKISNDQELMQSEPKSCNQNQVGDNYN